MKVGLLDSGGVVHLDGPAPLQEQDLTVDLGLETLWATMAAGDQLVFDVARRVTLRPLTDPAEIRRRQAVLADCLAAPEAIRSLCDLTGQAIAAPRHVWGLVADSPKRVLRSAVRTASGRSS